MYSTQNKEHWPWKERKKNKKIHLTSNPIQHPRPRSRLCQNDFLFHFAEAVPRFITSEFMSYSWGSPLELVSCLVKSTHVLFTLSVWFKRKGHFAGEIQLQLWQEAEIQNTKAHVTNCCVPHYAASIPHSRRYCSQIHDTGDSVAEVSALELTGVGHRILNKTGQVILAKTNVMLSLSLHHCTYLYSNCKIVWRNAEFSLWVWKIQVLNIWMNCDYKKDAS